MRVLPFLFILSSGLLTPGMMPSAIAQVTSDGTTNTIVNQNGNNFNILNGIEKGNNLFHSFSNFSVPTGGSANFDLTNTPNITTIFSRVTGVHVSDIQGLIQTLNGNNPVSLFLINPNGIIFGQNASLNIGGSFVGTTASSIKFADGTEFSAVNPSSSPLLTMSVPIGLQMGQNPGAITVQNTGHRLIANRNTPLQLGTTPTGLSVTSGNTLALVGGSISLDGGVLNATSGQIELSSASTGTVNLNLTTGKFDYANIQQFGDIQLSKAFVNASGAPAGAIHLLGRNVSLSGGSVALLTTQGNQTSGNIVVNASESFEMRGWGTFGFAFNFLRSENLGTGVGGDLVVSAPRVQILDAGALTSYNFGAGAGGRISITAVDAIEMLGISPTNPSLSSILEATTFGSGRGGNVQVLTGTFTAQDGGGIFVSTQGIGAGGDVTVNATQSIKLLGENPINLFSSEIVASTGSLGNTGQVTINTRKLSVQNGAVVADSTIASGNSGNLVVNVSDLIEVSGVGAQSGLPSRLVTNAEVLPAFLRNLLRLPDFPTGTVGDLIINTSRLQITDGGTVGVAHKGIGNAGNLYVNADTISLDRTGSITGATKSGEGGSISLQANTLVMRHGSNVTATAGDAGNGGNILINSPIILGLENSDIVANAVQGRGGNIDITTHGIFGLKYRSQLTLENDITASSEFGVNGNVQITSPDVDPNSGLVELPANVTDPSQQIATGCSANQGSSFVATGRGGIPQNPTQEVRSDRPWSDVRNLTAYRKTGEIMAQIPTSPETLIQATSWHRNAQGKIELIADKSSAQVQQPLTCAAVTKS
ncbi:MAG: S-layer family protein [Nostoc sp.]|uniref:S-layer family protein n=1 Tax=Nostoc sp. TaxID=1180 RepID=UPI002FFC454E